MKTILSLVAVAALAGSASSQVLSEDFSSGVPPTGWVQVVNPGGSGVGWILDSIGGRAWHEDEYLGGLFSDNTLVSPAFSLAGITSSTLTFDTETYYSSYLANNPLGYGDGISNMEISTDGGATWTVVWTDTAVVDNNYITEVVDISAFDGAASVQVGIHFFGTYAQEWWVDNVVVDGGGSGLVYSTSGLVGGASATLTVSGATAGGGVLIGYSLTGAGPTNTPFGPVDMSNPITQLPVLTADGAGVASMTTMVPGRATGFTVYTQAADLTSSTLTNSLAEVVL
jgi:hypothetical protein